MGLLYLYLYLFMYTMSDISPSRNGYYKRLRIGETINVFEVSIGISYVKTSLEGVRLEGGMTLK